MLGRPAVVAVCLLIVALVAGAPVAGAMQALTWPTTVYDGRTPAEAAAMRLAERHADQFESDLTWLNVRAPISDCVGKLLPPLTDATIEEHVRVLMLFWHDKQSSARTEASAMAVGSLLSLPRPILGALDGCVRASAVAALCDAWTAKRTGGAIAASRFMRTRSAAARDRARELLACSFAAAKSRS